MGKDSQKKESEQWIETYGAREPNLEAPKEKKFVEIFEAACREYHVEPKPKPVIIENDVNNVWCHMHNGKIAVVAATSAVLDEPSESLSGVVRRLVRMPEEKALPAEPYVPAIDFAGTVAEWINTGKAWRPRNHVKEERKLVAAFNKACAEAERQGLITEIPDLVIYPDLQKNASAATDYAHKKVGIISVSSGALAMPCEHLVAMVGHELGHAKNKRIKKFKSTMETIGNEAVMATGSIAGGAVGFAGAEVIPSLPERMANAVIRQWDKTHLLTHAAHLSSFPVTHLGMGSAAAVSIGMGAVGAVSAYAGAQEHVSELAQRLRERKEWPNELWADRMAAKIVGKQSAIEELTALHDSPYATAEETKDHTGAPQLVPSLPGFEDAEKSNKAVIASPVPACTPNSHPTSHSRIRALNERFGRIKVLMSRDPDKGR